MISELNGHVAVPSVIDLIRGSRTKRTKDIQQHRTLEMLVGKGKQHSFTWWHDFLHGPCKYHGFTTHHDTHPNRIILTDAGRARCSRSVVIESSQMSDDWLPFMTHISLGMLPRVSTPAPSPLTLSKVQQEVFDTFTEELKKFAATKRTLYSYVYKTPSLQKLILHAPTLSPDELLTRAEFDSAVFNKFPQVSPSHAGVNQLIRVIRVLRAIRVIRVCVN